MNWRILVLIDEFEADQIVILRDTLARALDGEMETAYDLIGLGIELEECGLAEEARQAYELAVQMEPLNPEASYFYAKQFSSAVAKALFEGRSFEEYALKALESFDKVLEISPTHADALRDSSLCLSLVERFNESIERSRRWAALAPDDVTRAWDSLFQIAICLLLEGRSFDEPIRQFQLMLEMMPGVPEGEFGLCLCALIKRDDLAVAETLNLLYESDLALAEGIMSLKRIRDAGEIRYRDVARVLMSVEVDVLDQSG